MHSLACIQWRQLTLVCIHWWQLTARLFWYGFSVNGKDLNASPEM